MPPRSKSKTDTTAEPEGFEGSLRTLERTVAELESGDLDLDAALAAYERGVRMLAACKGLLDQAEQKVALLTAVDDEGEPETAPLDSADLAPPKAAKASVEARPEPSPEPVAKPTPRAADGTPTPPWLDDGESGADDLPF